MSWGSASSAPSPGVAIPDDYEPIIRNYCKHFCTRLVQAVVQSRTNMAVETRCSTDTDWFNIHIDEFGEVTAQVRASARLFPPDVPHFSMDFLLYTTDGEILPLETWTVSFDPSLSCYPDSKSQIYHALGALLKAAISAARVTPMYRYYVRKQSADTFVILYRIVEGPSDVDLGTGRCERRLGIVVTPKGSVSLKLAYRTKMEIESPTTMHVTVGSPEPVSSSPASFQDLVSNFSVSPPLPVGVSPSEGAIRVGPAAMQRRSRLSSGASLSSASEVGSSPFHGSSPSSTPYHGERRSSQLFALSKDVPFAALLQCSLTGSIRQKPLFSLGGKNEEEDEEKPPMEGERTMTMLAEESQGMETSARTTSSTMVASTSETIKEEQREEEVEEEEESDSFIKVPQFSSSPKEETAELGEFIAAFKQPPSLHTLELPLDELRAQLMEFAANRPMFDAFVDKVRERSEKEFCE